MDPTLSDLFPYASGPDATFYFMEEGNTRFCTMYIRSMTSWYYPVGVDSVTLSYENSMILLLEGTWVQPKP